MRNLIRDGLSGLALSFVAVVLFAGLVGYFHGIALDGPDATYGLDGATTVIALILFVYWIYIAIVGLVLGSSVGFVARRIFASKVKVE